MLAVGALTVGAFVTSRGAPSSTGTAPSSVARVTAAGRGISTVWYISVRAREAGRHSRRFSDSLEFGYVQHSHRAQGDLVAGVLVVALEDSVRVTRAEFVAGLSAATGGAPPRDLAALHVHGFGTSLHECWQYASETRARSLARTPWNIFCWPSTGSRVARPFRDVVFSRAYVDDSTTAVASQPAFLRATHVVLEAVPHVQPAPRCAAAWLAAAWRCAREAELSAFAPDHASGTSDPLRAAGRRGAALRRRPRARAATVDRTHGGVRLRT